MLSWVVSNSLANYGDLIPNDGQGTVGVLVGSARIEGHPFDVYRIPSPPSTMYIFQAKQNLSRGGLGSVCEVAWGEAGVWCWAGWRLGVGGMPSSRRRTTR